MKKKINEKLLALATRGNEVQISKDWHFIGVGYTRRFLPELTVKLIKKRERNKYQCVFQYMGKKMIWDAYFNDDNHAKRITEKLVRERYMQ